MWAGDFCHTRGSANPGICGGYVVLDANRHTWVPVFCCSPLNERANTAWGPANQLAIKIDPHFNGTQSVLYHDGAKGAFSATQETAPHIHERPDKIHYLETLPKSSKLPVAQLYSTLWPFTDPGKAERYIEKIKESEETEVQCY